MSNKIQFLLYNVPEGDGNVQVVVKGETIWLTQKAMSLLFGTERSVITKHLNNIFKSGELNKDSVCANFAHTAEDGKDYQTNFYNLDAIISVGYRVSSTKDVYQQFKPKKKLKMNMTYSIKYRKLTRISIKRYRG